MTAAACIGEPVSWLRLEQLALAELADADAARAHLAACPVCAAAFERITTDVRPLPRLVVAPAPAAWWRRWLVPSGGLALAATIALVLLLVRKPDEALPARTARIKGVHGLVVVTLVRDRDGAIAFDPTDVRPADRWKVQLTCGDGAAWVDVAVYQQGVAFFPLAAQQVTCGNAVVVPGAFFITDGAADLCVALAPAAPDRARLSAGDRRGAICTTLTAP